MNRDDLIFEFEETLSLLVDEYIDKGMEIDDIIMSLKDAYETMDIHKGASEWMRSFN